MKNKKGFTLIAFIIIIALISIGAYILTELLYKKTEALKESKVSIEIEEILKASIGDLSTEFGFLGDMGRVPSSVGELIYKGSLPSAVENPSGSGIYSGWRGPYLSVRVKNASGIVDEFGNNYSILFLKDNGSGNLESCSSLCTHWVVFSPGKDGNYNSSYPLDRSYPENRDNLWAPDPPLRVYSLGAGNQYSLFSQKAVFVSFERSMIPPKNIRITIFYPLNGSPYSSSLSFQNPVGFSNVPVGKRAILVEVVRDDEQNVSSFLYSEVFPAGKSVFKAKIKEAIESLNITNIEFQSNSECSNDSACGQSIISCMVPSCRLIFRTCRRACCRRNRNQCRIHGFPFFCCLTCESAGGICYDNCCGGGGGGSECEFRIEVNSSLNVSGRTPNFFLLLKGFDEEGVKVFETSQFQVSNSSPFFVYESSTFPCNVKTVRIESQGAGGNITEAISSN